MKRLVVIVTLVGFLGGCAVFMKQTETLSVERQKFINAYARARILYAALAEGMARECAAGTRSREDCAVKAALHHEAKQLDAEIRAKIDTPETEVDWERVMKLLELGLSLAL